MVLHLAPEYFRRQARRARDEQETAREGFMADKNATTPETQQQSPQKQQMLIDYGPLVAFFIAYKMYDIKVGLAVLMVTIALAMLWAWKKLGHVSGMHKLTFGIVMVSGTLTFAFDDPKFFYVKPTIIYGLFTLILGIGMMRGKLFLKDMLAHIVGDTAPDTLWRRITWQAMAFFVSMMVINELVWRSVDEATWVNVKIFGFSGAMLVFTFVLIAQLFKYFPTEEDEG
jgi:intracellular septation protein